MRNLYQHLLDSVQDQELKSALREFHFRVKSLNLTTKTVSVYGERLGQFASYLSTEGTSFSDTDSTAVRSYVLSLIERGLAGDSVNGHIRVLKTFFSYLHEQDAIEHNPTAGLSLVKTERKDKPILSESDILKLLSVPGKSTFTGMRNYCMILVFYNTLIRLSELINITLDDLDLDSGVIRIVGKGRKHRTVPMSPETEKVLHRFLRKHHVRTGSKYLFCSLNGKPLAHRNINRIRERIGQKVGVHVSPHLIRHSGASHRALAGMPAFLLQRLLGHSTMQMTQRYVHLLDDEKLKEAVRKYGSLFISP